MERLHKIIHHLVIRYQHGSISSNFDIIRHVIENHITTEEGSLEEGSLEYKDNIREHSEKHKEFLQRIIELEKEVNEHIKLYKVHRL